ncbi:DUF4347 domain-containing protein, partial [Niveispirillum sp.]|uniref:DUF4347 domain-containing protein n=1 Tax=Niveispirillum sp. TaxID=1917217 RepID=UPI001B4B8FA3
MATNKGNGGKTKTPSPRRSKRVANSIALEPRMMFDAAAVATAADVVQEAATKPLPDHTVDDPAVTSLLASLTDVSPTPAASAAEPARREVAFIDTSVTDWQTLRDGVKEGVEIVLLDGSKDGLAQMAEWAEGKSGYDAIHVLSHGAEGQVQLGALTLDTATAGARSADLSALGAALTADGDLLLYGCSVASGEGKGFISVMAARTGADVAASDDATGATRLGGDWELEASAGIINSGDVIEAVAQRGYSQLLGAADTSPTLTATAGTGFVNQGSTVSVDLFRNVVASTEDTGQSFAGASITVSNVADITEYLTIGGTDVALTNGASGTIANVGSYSVSVSGGTATLTLSGMALSNAQMAVLVDGMTYKNSDASVTTGTRTVTLAGITDSGASNNTASPGLAATVTVSANAALVVTTSLDSGDDATNGASLSADITDGGGLSLREALYWANNTAGLDKITFSSVLKGSTIKFSSAMAVSASQALIIDGDVDGDGIADITLSGDKDNSNTTTSTDVAAFTAGADLTLNSLNFERFYGGAVATTGVITATAGTLTISNSVFHDNMGQISLIRGSGSNISNTIVRDNVSSTTSPTAWLAPFRIQGGTHNFENVIIVNNTINYNPNQDQTNIGLIQLVGSGRPITFTGNGLTIADNYANNTHATFTINSGLAIGIAANVSSNVYGSADVSIHNSIIANNTLKNGSSASVTNADGISYKRDSASDSVSINGVAKATGAATLTSLGENFIGATNGTTAKFVNATTGSTADYRPADGATDFIDAGDDSDAAYYSSNGDIRGLERIRGTKVDLGAYEVVWGAGNAPTVDLDTGTSGVNASVTISVPSTGGAIAPAPSVGQLDADTRITSMVATISGGLADSTSEVLFLTDAQVQTARTLGIGVTGNNSATLTLTGGSSLVSYQTILGLIAYKNTAASPTAGIRTVTVSATDDTSSSVAASSVTVSASSGDTTPPTFDVAPSVGSATSSGFTPSASLDEAGTVYYVVVANNAGAPTAAQVKAGQDSTGATALKSGNSSATTGSFDSSFSAITGLTAGTDYDVYFVAEDSATNLMTTPVKVDASTSAGASGTTPTLSATHVPTGFIQGESGGVDLFSGVTAATNDVGQTFAGATLTVTNVADTTEYLVVAGTRIALTNGTSGSISGVGNYAVSMSGSTATVTLSGITASDDQMAGLIDGIQYFNSDASVTAGTRTVTLTGISDNGGSNNTASLNIANTVNVMASASTLTVTVGTDTDTVGADLTTDINDGGGLSLREALYWAEQTNDADTIKLATNVTLSGDLTGDPGSDATLISLTKSLLVDLNGFTVDGGSKAGFFFIGVESRFALQNGILTNFSDQSGNSASAVYVGVGADNSNASGSIRNVTVSNSQAGTFVYFGPVMGQAARAGAKLSFQVDNGTFFGNAGDGGTGTAAGVYFDVGNSNTTAASVSINNSAFYTNGSSTTPAINSFIGAAAANLKLSINNSTVAGNSNGVLLSDGYSTSSSYVVRNSIITDNISANATGTISTINSITTNSSVNFVNSAGGDYRLASTASNALNQGDAFYVIGDLDVRGLLRVRNGGVDIGAYESWTNGTAPSVDLNGGTSGVDYTNPATTGFGSGVLVTGSSSAATVTDGEGRVWKVTATLSGILNTGNEELFLSDADLLSAHTAGIRVSGNGTSSLTLEGGATDAAFQTVLRNIQYKNTATTISTGARTVTLQATDDATSSSAVATLNVVGGGDTTPPTFDVAPSVGSATSSGFTPSASIDEAGTVYYVVVANNAGAPSASQVKAGQDSTGATALKSGNSSATTGSFDSSFSAITGLTAGTDYDVYF